MDSFGHYTILERLHAGAMGELSRARDARLGRTVALRIVSPDIAAAPERRDALLADAAAAAALSHPHIAALFDFGEEAGRLYLAHEYVPGQSLRALMTGQPIDVELALEFVVQLADALAEGHRQGVVHGNVCPATIFVTPTDQTKIIEFGLASWTSGGMARAAIARQLGAGEDPAAPGARDVVPYMSPEQLLTGRVEPRSDIFSLGVVLHEMLTGRAPFEADTAGSTAVKVLQGSLPPATRENPSLAKGFDAILTRAMAKSLDARYPSASAMAADLRALAAQLNVRVSAEIATTKAEKPKKAKKMTEPRGPALRKLAAALAATLVVGAAAAGAWYWRTAIAGLFSREGPVPRPILLVVPFQTAGSEENRAYYGVGFAEDLAARLGEVPGLNVVGRSSIVDASNVPLAERASRIGAAVALRGTTRPGPYSLHVDAELVEVATGSVLWSAKYAREPRQASAVEVEIARQVAERLHLQMPTGNRWARAQSRQVDPGAYDLYLQARDAAAHRDRSRAIALFRQAIDMDPRLAEARVGLSDALYLEDFYSGNSGDAATLRNARVEAETALGADPDMPRALLAAALSASTTGAAASSLARALALDPSYGEAWHHAGDLVIEVDPLRAVAYYSVSLRFDPSIDSSHRDIAAAYEMLDRTPDAEAAVERGRAARPDRPWWTQMSARLAIATGHFDKAVELLATQTATESSPSTWLVGRVIPLAMVPKTDSAKKEAARLIERYPWYCEAQAVAAGLEWDTNGKQKARALVDSVLARAAAPDAPSTALQCAAAAASSVGDGPEAAGYLAKLAASDQALRAWTRQGVFNMAFAFRRRLYPWNKVEGSGPFRQASEAMVQSLARLGADVARKLPAPPSEDKTGRN